MREESKNLISDSSVIYDLDYERFDGNRKKRAYAYRMIDASKIFAMRISQIPLSAIILISTLIISSFLSEYVRTVQMQRKVKFAIFFSILLFLHGKNLADVSNLVRYRSGNKFVGLSK